jgi:hypothetical protein
MKFLSSIFFIIFLSGISSNLSAQNKYGAFGAPVIKYTSISNRNALILGVKFGLAINESIVIGGGFYGTIKDINIKDKASGEKVILNMNYGGLEMEYLLFPHSLIHGSLGILLAGGGLYFGASDKSATNSSYPKLDLLLYEPSVNIEFNTLSWMHIDLNISYRIITSYDYVFYGISKDDLTGPSVGLIFKLGSY